MTAIKVGVAFLGSFALTATALGITPSPLAFWALPFLYGWSLLCLAWPLYVRTLTRPGVGRWTKPLVGAALFPIPSLILQLQHWAINGELVLNPLRFFGDVYIVFLIWYVLFGAVLGAAFALSTSSRRAAGS